MRLQIFLNEIYSDIDITTCSYFEVGEYILEFCNYDSQELLSYVRSDKNKFKEWILKGLGLS